MASVALVSVGPRSRGREGSTSCKIQELEILHAVESPITTSTFQLSSFHTVKCSLQSVSTMPYYAHVFPLNVAEAAHDCVSVSVLLTGYNTTMFPRCDLPQRQSRGSPCVSGLMKAGENVKRPSGSTVFSEAAMDVVS